MRKLKFSPGYSNRKINWPISLLLLVVFFSTLVSSCSNDQKVPTSGGSTYTSLQQVFCLNVLSNVSAHFNKTNPDSIQLKTQIAIDSVLNDDSVQSLIGNWTRVWGPVVYAVDSQAINTMYIVKQDTAENYVVAIAGTNATSITDWLSEDFDLIKMIGWPYNNDVDSSKKISLPTATGLLALTTMISPSGFKNLPLPAVAYLKECALLHKINVWVTGHSLGGALSPAYALFLNDTRNAVFGVGNNATINCLGVAGASPGNDSFSAYYNRQLGSNTYRVWNQMDVVPHGFQPNMIMQIPNLYNSDTLILPFPATEKVKGVTVNMNDLLIFTDSIATAFRMLQLYPQDTVNFTGGLYHKPSSSGLDTTEYLIEALYQHVPAYGVFFGIGAFQSAVQRVLGLSSPFFSVGLPPVNVANYDTTGKGFNANKFIPAPKKL